jgi:hypothetical protein
VTPDMREMRARFKFMFMGLVLGIVVDLAAEPTVLSWFGVPMRPVDEKVVFGAAACTVAWTLWTAVSTLRLIRRWDRERAESALRLRPPG